MEAPGIIKLEPFDDTEINIDYFMDEFKASEEDKLNGKTFDKLASLYIKRELHDDSEPCVDKTLGDEFEESYFQIEDMKNAEIANKKVTTDSENECLSNVIVKVVDYKEYEERLEVEAIDVKEAVDRHMETPHNNGGKFKENNINDSLKIHEQEENLAFKFECSYCRKKYRYYAACEKHEKSHKSTEKYINTDDNLTKTNTSLSYSKWNTSSKEIGPRDHYNREITQSGELKKSIRNKKMDSIRKVIKETYSLKKPLGNINLSSFFHMKIYYGNTTETANKYFEEDEDNIRIKREINRLKVAQYRAKMSVEQKGLMREKNRMRAAWRKRNLSEEEKILLREKTRLQVSRYRADLNNRLKAAQNKANMSEGKRALLRETNRLQTIENRANMSDEKKALLRETNRLRNIEKRANMSDEKRAILREANRLRNIKRRANLSEEKKAELREKHRRVTAIKRAKAREEKYAMKWKND